MTPPTVNAYYSSIDNKIGECDFVLSSAAMSFHCHILLSRQWVLKLCGYNISCLQNLIESSLKLFLKTEKKSKEKK